MRDHQIDIWFDPSGWTYGHCSFCPCRGALDGVTQALVVKTHAETEEFRHATVSTYMANKLGIRL